MEFNILFSFFNVPDHKGRLEFDRAIESGDHAYAAYLSKKSAKSSKGQVSTTDDDDVIE